LITFNDITIAIHIVYDCFSNCMHGV